MIFGFNTDVKFADTVYHVQSEARQHELVLQTLVFLKGRCIGKLTSSYAEQTKQPGFSEEHMHEMLKDQHKHFVAVVRGFTPITMMSAPWAAFTLLVPTFTFNFADNALARSSWATVAHVDLPTSERYCIAFAVIVHWAT